MLYRIFTERKRVRRNRRICNRFFNAYTPIPTQGVWNGKAEKSLCIEVFSDGQDGYLKQRVDAAAEEIRELNGQECVLVTYLACTGILI